MIESSPLTRRNRKRTEIQNRILQCAMKLFREQGLDNTTMESIATAADVAKRTLYSYFPVKEAIVSAYWIDNARRQSKLLPRLLENYPDTRSRLVAIFLSAAEGFMAEPSFARAHFSYQFQQLGKSPQPVFHSDFDRFLTNVLVTGQAEGDLRNDIEAYQLAQQIMFNFTAICLMWFSNPDAFSLNERLTFIAHCFIDGAGVVLPTVIEG